METRFSFGGDEHLLCECSEEMSFEAFFKAINSVEQIRSQIHREFSRYVVVMPHILLNLTLI